MNSKSTNNDSQAGLRSAAAADGSVLDLVTQQLPEFNKSFRKVAAYLLSNPDAFMRKPLQEIALNVGVSQPSVVRFCRHFGFKGVPDFRIGLATSLARGGMGRSAIFIEPGVTDKATMNLARKRAIAKHAVSLLGADRALILDSGSTSQLFAEELKTAKPLTILTTGFNSIETLRSASQHTVMIPGGTVRYESNSVTGRMAEAAVKSMRFDTFYLGVDAIDIEHGLSAFNEDEAHQNAAMMNACERVVVLSDSSKFRAPALHRICHIDRVHAIVTDSGLSDELTQLIEAKGVVVHRVETAQDEEK